LILLILYPTPRTVKTKKRSTLFFSTPLVIAGHDSAEAILVGWVRVEIAYAFQVLTMTGRGRWLAMTMGYVLQ